MLFWKIKSRSLILIQKSPLNAMIFAHIYLFFCLIVEVDQQISQKLSIFENLRFPLNFGNYQAVVRDWKYFQSCCQLPSFWAICYHCIHNIKWKIFNLNLQSNLSPNYHFATKKKNLRDKIRPYFLTYVWLWSYSIASKVQWLFCIDSNS